MIAAGLLKERITIGRYESIQQPDLSYIDSWVTLLECFAQRKMQDGALQIVMTQDVNIQPFTFTIRYRDDVVLRIGDNLIYRGNTFKIHYFMVDVARTYIEIFVKADNSSVGGGNV